MADLPAGEAKYPSQPEDPAARVAYLVRKLVGSLRMRDWTDEPNPGEAIAERRAWMQELVSLGSVSIPFLAFWGNDKDWAIRQEMAIVLGRIGGDEAVEVLRVMHDGSPHVLSVESALARAGGPSIRAELRTWYQAKGITAKQRVQQIMDDEHLFGAPDPLFEVRVAEVAARRKTTSLKIRSGVSAMDDIDEPLRPLSWLLRRIFREVELTQEELAYLDIYYI